MPPAFYITINGDNDEIYYIYVPLFPP